MQTVVAVAFVSPLHATMMSTSSVGPAPRRSKRSNAGKLREELFDYNFTGTGRRLYRYMDHHQLQKCITTISNASEEDILQLAERSISFVAMAVSATSAHDTVSKRNKVLEYAHAVTDRGLDANDKHKGDSALALACYYGYYELAEYLLQIGSSLESCGRFRNAVEASVRNSQRQVLALLLERRPQEVSTLFRRDAFSTTFRSLILKKDVESVRLLVSVRGIIKPTMSDETMAHMKQYGRENHSLLPTLQQLYPSLPNVASWTKKIHWSFPTSDRETLNLLWYMAGVKNAVFPSEIWLLVFSYVGRGWFVKEAPRCVIALSARPMW